MLITLAFVYLDLSYSIYPNMSKPGMSFGARIGIIVGISIVIIVIVTICKRAWRRKFADRARQAQGESTVPENHVPDILKAGANTGYIQTIAMPMPSVENKHPRDLYPPKYTPTLFNSPQELEQFPITFLNQRDEPGGVVGAEVHCRLCGNQIPQGTLVRSIQCRHPFHVSCLDYHLLSRSTNCPVCNLNLRNY